MSSLNKVKYLVGSEDYETKPFKPYNKITCDFLAEFSKKLNLQMLKVYRIIKFLTMRSAYFSAFQEK